MGYRQVELRMTFHHGGQQWTKSMPVVLIEVTGIAEAIGTESVKLSASCVSLRVPPRRNGSEHQSKA